MKTKIALLLILALGACSTTNEFQVSRVGEEPEKYLERKIYVLPQTSFLVSIHIERETLIPGPYRLYTDRFLGIDGAIEEPGVNYRITGVEMKAIREPDPNHYYSINTLKGHAFDLFRQSALGIPTFVGKYSHK